MVKTKRASYKVSEGTFLLDSVVWQFLRKFRYKREELLIFSFPITVKFLLADFKSEIYHQD